MIQFFREKEELNFFETCDRLPESSLPRAAHLPADMYFGVFLPGTIQDEKSRSE